MSSDPVSATTRVVPVTEVDAHSAYAVATDSINVLLKLGKRQNAEMEAASSSAAAAVRVKNATTLPDLAGTGMQVDVDLEDLDNTQVNEPEVKRWKGESRRTGDALAP